MIPTGGRPGRVRGTHLRRGSVRGRSPRGRQRLNALGSEGRDEAITATCRALDKATLDTELLAALTQLGVSQPEARYEEAIDSFERPSVSVPTTSSFSTTSPISGRSREETSISHSSERSVLRESPYRGEYWDTLGVVWMAMAKAAADDEDRRSSTGRRDRNWNWPRAQLKGAQFPIQLAELEIELGNPDKARRFLAERDREPSEELQAEIERLLEPVRGG